MRSKPNSVDTESRRCWELVLPMDYESKNVVFLRKEVSPSRQVLGQNTALDHSCFLEGESASHRATCPKQRCSINRQAVVNLVYWCRWRNACCTTWLLPAPAVLLD